MAAHQCLAALRDWYPRERSYLHWGNGGCLIAAEGIMLALRELGEPAEVVRWPVQWTDHYVANWRGQYLDATGRRTLPRKDRRFKCHGPVGPSRLRHAYKRSVRLSRQVRDALLAALRQGGWSPPGVGLDERDEARRLAVAPLRPGYGFATVRR